MIARAGSGWQTVLADLSLILFMVTASAVSPGASDAPPPPSPSARSEPLAMWQSGPEAPPIGQWLRDQGADPRQQLTIIARYGPGEQARTLGEAGRMVREAAAAGMQARLTLEPGARSGIAATLAFDAPEAILARNLREPAH